MHNYSMWLLKKGCFACPDLPTLWASAPAIFESNAGSRYASQGPSHTGTPTAPSPGHGVAVVLAVHGRVIPMAILLTWVFNATRRSTLAAILFHFMANLTYVPANVTAGTNRVRDPPVDCRSAGGGRLLGRSPANAARYLSPSKESSCL